MPSSIIRGSTVFTEPADRRYWHQIDDGALQWLAIFVFDVALKRGYLRECRTHAQQTRSGQQKQTSQLGEHKLIHLSLVILQQEYYKN